MKIIHGLFISLLLVFCINPLIHAYEATLVSITPSAEDITDEVPETDPGMENINIFVYQGSQGAETQYTAVYSVDEEPAVVVVVGSEMESWNYDEDTGLVTIVFNYVGMLEEVEFEDNAFGIAIVWPVPEGEDGPPEEATGMYMATNVQEWELIPPSEEQIAFGFTLTGPVDETGFFHMFIPDSLIEFLAEVTGEEIDIQDLAVYNGDYQASLEISEVEGGALVTINVVFSEDSTEVSSYTVTGGEGANLHFKKAGISNTVPSDKVTKTLTVGEKLDLSLAARETEIGKEDTTLLYGWVRDGSVGDSVVVKRKVDGSNKFKRFKTVTVGENGYFSVNLSPNKTAQYKAVYATDGAKLRSPSVKITVRTGS